MEQIKVNMTPCGFTPTIHASQNDNSTRKWGFELYDEDGKIDSSSIKEQMIFDSRVGGTEQILPENGSEPTTSPIIADIQYPDALRSEQEFLYRESPTAQDGQAKITKIKGNTIPFNQLEKCGRAGTTVNSVVITKVDGGYNYNGTASADIERAFDDSADRANIILGHKYYYGGITGGSLSTYYVALYVAPSLTITDPIIFSANSNIPNLNVSMCIKSGYQINKTIYPTLIDLTSMGIDSLTTTSEVEAWLSSHIGNLPYYAYTQGKLLPFLGEELKTTGKNLLPKVTEQTTLYGITYIPQADGSVIANGTATNWASYNWLTHFLLLSGTYTVSGTPNVSDTYITIVNEENRSISYSSVGGSPLTFTLTVPTYVTIRLSVRSGQTLSNAVFKPQLEFGSSASSYEPYTSSTINLPTLTYFSSGMKSAGSVYDELTESKAITRIGSVDLGSLSWNVYSLGNSCTYYALVSGKQKGNNVLCSNYVITNASAENMEDKTAKGRDNDNVIFVRDTSYSDKTTFKQAMADQNVKLYYELATSTEESITTASLVTEKGETPLYYDDELIADCNETISSESGIFDAKIKLMDDNTIYSQKIQLHVERKPQ